MTPGSTDRLADSTVRELIDELKASRDSTEELYILLDHIWRNRDEFRDMLAQLLDKRAENSTEVVCCVHCDESHPKLSEAVQAGWTSFQHDPTEGWDYLGICPDCVKQQAEYDRKQHVRIVAGERFEQEKAVELEEIARVMGLSEEQIAQAKAEGVTTVVGLRRIAKNSRLVVAEAATDEGQKHLFS